MWEHQEAAVQHALRLPGAMMAMDMGTGKSRVAIETWERLGRPKTLVIAPKSVATGVWPAQIEQWRWKNKPQPRVEVLDSSWGPKYGMSASARKIKAAMRSDIAIINYEAVWRKNIGEAMRIVPFKLVVLDESHRIKSPSGKASRYIARLCRKIPRRLALTGTPMPHSPMDIYAQYRAIAPHIYTRTAALFRARYAIYGGWMNKQIVAWQNKDELAEKFRSIAYEVKTDDVLTLPPSVDSTRTFQLSPKAQNIYESLEDTFWAEVEKGIVYASNALVKLLRLAQVTSGYLIPDGETQIEELDDGKRNLLIDIIADSPPSERLVVFCRFRHDIETVMDVARKASRPCFETSGRIKQQDAWRESDGGVLAVQMQAGSLGLDLTAARTAVFFSLGFSLGEYLQARARLRRPGQTARSVQYIHLVAKDSVDERIMRALIRRENVIKSILEAGR